MSSSDMQSRLIGPNNYISWATAIFQLRKAKQNV